jgi:hypothetical protein
LRLFNHLFIKKNTMNTYFLLDAESMDKLRKISERLQGGSDAMRDEGHKLWLILQEVVEVPPAWVEGEL